MTFWQWLLENSAPVMVIITGLSICISILLNWLDKHRQFKLSRPRLHASIIISNQAYYLRIYNSGKYCATDVNIAINNDFIENLPTKWNTKKVFENLVSSPFYIEAEDSKYYFIGFCGNVHEAWTDKNIKLVINGTYCGSYKLKETLIMDHFINKSTFIVNEELTLAIEEIGKKLTKTTDAISKIEKTLNQINNEIKQHNQNNAETRTNMDR